MGGFKRFPHYGIEVAGFSPDGDNAAELAGVFAGQLGTPEEQVALYFDELRMAKGTLWVVRDATLHQTQKPTVHAVAGTQIHQTGTPAHPAKQTVFSALGARAPEQLSTEAALAAIVYRSLGDGKEVGPLDDINAPEVPEALFGAMGRIGLDPVEASAGGTVSMLCRASHALLRASGILFPPANHRYLDPPLGLPTLRH